MATIEKSLAAPKVTVVTPSFNQGAYIARTIESVLSQGYRNLEYIVIDGGSRDDSVEVIRKYERYLTFWVSESDRGQSHAINKGLARAEGSILTWLNSDDWYEKGALAHFVERFQANPGVGVVVGRGQIVDQFGKLVYDKAPTEKINFDSMCGWLEGGNFMQPSSAFSKTAWDLCGPLSENIHIALDLDLWLKMAKAGVSFVTTPVQLSTALSHPEAKTTALVDETKIDCARVIAAYGSHLGYEQMINSYVSLAQNPRRREKMMQLKLDWYEKNYRAVLENPLTRFLQPIVKRFSAEGRYWQSQIPPWKD